MNDETSARVTRLGRLGSGVLLCALAATSACSGGDDDSGSPAKSGSSGSSGGSQATGQGGSSVGGDGATGGGATGGSSASGGSSSSSGGKGGAADGSGGSGGKGGSTATGGSAGQGGSSATGGSGGTGTSSTSSAADLARMLGRSTNFMIGMGNDLNNDHSMDGAYTLGVTMDLHYAYLVGLLGKGGWPDWNSGGTFVNILTDSADMQGTTPMFDLYAMAANGEGNASALTDSDYMTRYWQGAKLLFQRLGVFDKPAVVHLEPDFWGFFQQQSKGDPSSIKVLIHGLADECADQPEDLAGLGHCLLTLSRMYAPKTAIGFHASQWAGDPASMVTFLTAVGAADADFIGMDMLDRDAGCFEAHTDSGCQRNDGPWYWDESNATSPNFHDYLAYSKQISDGLGKPIIWWQIPFGVPSDTPGGTAGHYRDNRVHYIFSHVGEFIDAGGAAVTFGVGAGNQTYIDSDGNQFHDAVNAYYANPTPLK